MWISSFLNIICWGDYLLPILYYWHPCWILVAICIGLLLGFLFCSIDLWVCFLMCIILFFFYFIFKLYIIVLFLPYIKMNLPQVYMLYICKIIWNQKVSVFFFFLKIILAFHNFCGFIWILGFFFFNLSEKYYWNFHRDFIESVDCFVQYGHFMFGHFDNIILLIHTHKVAICYLCLISSISYRFFNSLVKFIPKYFILYDAIVNGIVFLISFLG